MAAVAGYLLLMNLALVGLISILKRFDRRRPGDLRGVAPVVPMPRPGGTLAPRRVVVMNPGDDGVFRAS